ncbi:MAG: TauD/TfdA family dioxygenase [Pseudomonadota bacterium]
MAATPTRHPDFTAEPITDASFGHEVVVRAGTTEQFVGAAEANPSHLRSALNDADGLLLLRGMDAISAAPELLLRLSRVFGTRVENYRETLTGAHRIHPEVPQILRVANAPPVKQQPPPKPEPPLSADGRLPTRFPHRRGWHTDQSYRRPPPDVSLFYAHQPAPRGQAQTIYANGTAAYAALPPSMKARADALIGLHVMPKSGRSEQNLRAGGEPLPLLAHQLPQRQPVVRVHPETGRPALFLCEAGQMDWLEGPFVDVEAGIDGEGKTLLYELMHHYTADPFVYAHDWSPGDLIIYDNRSTIHAATWFDADACEREMWRTTVAGNPGPEYEGERPSWIPVDAGVDRLQGIAHL